MTALTAPRIAPERPGRIVQGRVGASTTIHQGALLEIAATGHVAPATKAQNKTYWGIALESAKTVAGETATIDVRHGATIHFAGDATLDTAAEKLATLGDSAYVADDQTVSTTATGSTACGVIVDYDDDGVWVALSR